MARVALDHKVPQIGKPVGSRQEIVSLDLPTRNIATCSRREERENFGCPEYNECDRDFRGQRPENEIVRTTTSDGNMRVQCMVCFETVRKERNADAKGMLVEVIGHEGDEYTYRGSVKMHPKRDPNCNKCSEGKCEAYVDREDLTAICPPYPPAAEHRDLIKFARMREARTKTKLKTQESNRRRIYGAPEPPEVDEPAVKGKAAVARP